MERDGRSKTRAMNEADIRAAAGRILAPGSGATDDARVVAAAWLAEHPTGDAPCVEIEDTPGACQPDAG